jgi:putative endonuclease
MRPHHLGTSSESHAAKYLEHRGYEIIARNFRVLHKEIDIIARQRKTIAFVEVKARSAAGCGHPLEAITWKKRREIAQVASAWIDRHGDPRFIYRFDAIAVVWRGHVYTIEHIENAWAI